MDQFRFLLLVQTIIFYGVFFFSGVFLRFFPPKRINKLYGYRTPKAIKNEATWRFAQRYASQSILIMSPLCLFVSILTKYLSDFNFSAAGLYILIDILLLIIMTILVYFLTESALYHFIHPKESNKSLD